MKILIVEDDFPSRIFLSESLKSQGYTCLMAEDGRVGLEISLREKPDLIISDIRMPNMDGLKMLAEIRRQNPDVIVIMMTAFGSEEYALEALRSRANDYLPKPVRHEVLFPLIRKYGEVVQNRTLGQEILGMVVERSSIIRFDNRLHLVPRIVDHLMVEATPFLPRDTRLGIHLGLLELLANAIEHGNLGITFQEKNAALESNHDDGFEKLLAERLANPELESRRVTIEFRLDQQACEWTIRDEGQGFDWKTLPNPTNDENLLEAHGRGVFLSRIQFDTLEYLGAGNVVKARKILPPQPK